MTMALCMELIAMKILPGKISTNTFGVASNNLSRVMSLIEERMTLPNLVPGTLNIEIEKEYIVKSDAIISPHEYGFQETIKLQRCLINGYKAIIMRPDTHETRPNWGHGKSHLELMSPYHLRDTLEGNNDWWCSGK